MAAVGRCGVAGGSEAPKERCRTPSRVLLSSSTSEKIVDGGVGSMCHGRTGRRLCFPECDFAGQPGLPVRFFPDLQRIASTPSENWLSPGSRKGPMSNKHHDVVVHGLLSSWHGRVQIACPSLNAQCLARPLAVWHQSRKGPEHSRAHGCKSGRNAACPFGILPILCLAHPSGNEALGFGEGTFRGVLPRRRAVSGW